MREIKDLEELKKIELGIMKHIHRFCVDNDISYCLCYGTLIGAIRHNGFIPWDDDIDIFMFREDYEKFCQTFPSYGKEQGLYITKSDTSPCLPRAMAKVCDARTVLNEPKYRFGDNIGIFVDIWPLDGAPESKLKRTIHFNKMLWCHRMFFAALEKKEYFKGNLARRILRSICNCLGPLNVERYIEKQAIKYPVKESGYVECYADRNRNYTYREFKPFQLHKFEDAEFYIPNNYDSVLRKVYGDYMELPPKNQRIPHHIINTFWLEEGDNK